MARRPKPWYWKARKGFYVTIGGKQHPLGSDKAEAHRRFHELMAKPKTAIVAGSVAEVIEHFMDWLEVHRPKSYEWYKKRIDKFYPTIRDFRIADLKPHHIQKELDAHEWSDAFKAGCVTALKRCFNWAVEQEHIDKNPLRGLKKPEAGHREQTLTQDEFDTALSHVPNPNFHDIAGFVWYTGCRPEEAVKITPEMVDLAQSRIVIPRPEAKKKKRPRIIYLCPEAREIVERNMGNSPLFLNTKGRPWTAFSIACTWGRIEKKTGIRYCSYALRHSYATHQLQTGTDAVTVATLLGHSDTSMLAKVYANLSPEYLASKARRNGGS